MQSDIKSSFSFEKQKQKWNELLIYLACTVFGEKLKPWPCYREYDNASSYDFPAKTTVSVEVVNIARYTLRENVPL